MLFINMQCGKLFICTDYYKKIHVLEPRKCNFLCSAIRLNGRKLDHTGKRRGKIPSWELVSEGWELGGFAMPSLHA